MVIPTISEYSTFSEGSQICVMGYEEGMNKFLGRLGARASPLAREDIKYLVSSSKEL